MVLEKVRTDGLMTTVEACRFIDFACFLLGEHMTCSMAVLDY